MRLRLHSSYILRRRDGEEHRLAAGKPVSVRGWISRRAWGILGFLSLWIGGSFWIATGLGWSFFLLGATYGHVMQTLREGDFAPYNFFTIFSDGFIAFWLLLLIFLYSRWGIWKEDRAANG
ncbi:DUF6790 family protein [Methylocystis sp.]|uniref:DUF6790 family protein n=1 Tax=Methylocystis sp. TaxID=1911079 RepID=UPI00345B8770